MGPTPAIVTYLDKVLYGNYLFLIASSKQKINREVKKQSDGIVQIALLSLLTYAGINNRKNKPKQNYVCNEVTEKTCHKY